MQRPLLKPTGGPTGYNYNLASQLESKEVQNIYFIEKVHRDVSNFNNKVKNIRCRWLRLIITVVKSIYRKGKLLYGLHHYSMVDLTLYDIVHFQSTNDLFSCRDSLKNYKGKVVLTSHSPTLLSKEYISYLTQWEQKHMMWFYKKLIRMDEYAFDRADYIIFPCEEAEEPYYNNWEKFAEFKNLNSHKFRYLLSGINPCKAKLSRKEVREKYGIPENAFVISYVGRHNELKGYDRLKEIGTEMLKDGNVYFLIAGVEAPIKGLNHPHWIEIGWTTDPHSPINAADLFLLPNKETYFDLVLLEVLSLGKMILATYTGGNRYFDKLKPNGIITYTDKSDAITKIKEIMNLSIEDRVKIGDINHTLFVKYFTSSTFADSYIRLVENL